MQENVGNADRWLRVVVGGALVLGGVRALSKRGVMGQALMLAAGTMMLETALTRVCPLNAALGIDTRGWEPFRRLAEVSGEQSADQPKLGGAATRAGGDSESGSNEHMPRPQAEAGT